MAVRTWTLIALGSLLSAGTLAFGCAGSDTDGGGTGNYGTGNGGAGASTGSESTTGTPSRTGSTSMTGSGGVGGDPNCTDEVCDGVDNDCDGETDENCDCTEGQTQPCYSGDPNTRGIGSCQDGEQICDIMGKWSLCDGEVLPTDEECNGDDDDCNGEDDDGFETLTCGQGICQNTVESCENGTPQQCEPLDPPDPNEDCDGEDDDCDGEIDEGCICTNGQTQPCYSGSPITNGVGICHGGTSTCSNGAWGPCVGEQLPENEICDALDQNCDNDVDQGTCDLPDAIASCTGGDCVISSCSADHSNCDQNDANGCEIDHAEYVNAPPGLDLGVWSSDAVYGLGCTDGGTCEGPIVTVEGNQAGYVFIDAIEDSACCAYIGMRFELIVPDGVDYDLHLSGTGCYADPDFYSMAGTGIDEDIVVWCDDDCLGGADGFYVDVEIRHWSGATCVPWQLNVYRRAC